MSSTATTSASVLSPRLRNTIKLRFLFNGHVHAQTFDCGETTPAVPLSAPPYVAASQRYVSLVFRYIDTSKSIDDGRHQLVVSLWSVRRTAEKKQEMGPEATLFFFIIVVGYWGRRTSKHPEGRVPSTWDYHLGWWIADPATSIYYIKEFSDVL